jgi:hypothetical protein
MKYLHIEYANPSNTDDVVTLNFRLRDNPVVERWVHKVLTAQQQYSIDDPARFYGFGKYEDQVADAIQRINHCVTVINLYNPIIDRELTDVHDQDTLNYLHHIFEMYHGLLDANFSTFWSQAPDSVKRALADLNLCVHRCESIARGAQPRHVVTYYGLPKDSFLVDGDYAYFEDTWAAGTVFINYVEIGKTLADLAVDKDQYISPTAFQPFRHYSADFVVRLFERTEQQAMEKRAIITQYYEKNQKFFGPWQSCFVDGNIPVADLDSKLDLVELTSRQFVKTVSFT